MCVHGEVVGKKYNDFIDGTPVYIGSLKNNSVARTEKIKPNTIAVISHFRSKYPNYIRKTKPFRIVLPFLQEYAQINQKELQIISARLPDAPRKLAEQVTAFIQEMRETELFKIPGVTETLDWLSALLALNQTELDPSVIDDTLGMMLKYQDDIDSVKGDPVRDMLERSKNRGIRRGGRRRG